MKKKVGILTTLALMLSKIVYANQTALFQGGIADLYGPPQPPPKLYGVPVDPPVEVMYGIAPIEEAPTILDILLKVGKIAIVPIILIIGIVAIIKMKKKKNKNDKTKGEG